MRPNCIRASVKKTIKQKGSVNSLAPCFSLATPQKIKVTWSIPKRSCNSIRALNLVTLSYPLLFFCFFSSYILKTSLYVCAMHSERTQSQKVCWSEQGSTRLDGSKWVCHFHCHQHTKASLRRPLGIVAHAEAVLRKRRPYEQLQPHHASALMK